MLIVLYFILLLLNVFFAVRKKQSKLVAIITSLYILILFVGSQGTVDLDNYLNSYIVSYKELTNDSQSTFHFLQSFFLNHGYDFYYFRFFLTLLSLTGLYFFATRFFSCANLIYTMYMLFLFVMDDIQLRNFTACTFFYLGILVLFSDFRAKKIIFATLIIFASTIHVAFFAYLLFLIIPLDNPNSKYAIKIGILFFAFSIFFLFFRSYSSFISNLLLVFDSKRAENYSILASNYGGAYFIALQLATSMYFLYAYFQESKKTFVIYDEQNKKNINLRKILFLYVNINFMAFAYCSLTIFSITFYRLLRNLYLINIAGFYATSMNKKDHYYWIPTLLYLAFWLLLDIFPKGRFDLYIVPIFTNNFLIIDLF